jgi:hypothetical protein
VRYIGESAKVKIPDEITRIDDGCFRYCDIIVVKFGPNPKVSSIGIPAFAVCRQLLTITIPSTVTVLGDGCFDSFKSLELVAFRAGSKLEEIANEVFDNCVRLKSTLLPSSVKTIGGSGFRNCWDLQLSPIPVDSNLVRIGAAAFMCCWSLKAMLLPSLLEPIGIGCFSGSDLISRLAFGLPSRLRELLSLPAGLCGGCAIPDSVESLTFNKNIRNPCRVVLTFRSDSRLAAIGLPNPAHILSCRIFLQVSSRSLKLFRRDWERPSH